MALLLQSKYTEAGREQLNRFLQLQLSIGLSPLSFLEGRENLVISHVRLPPPAHHLRTCKPDTSGDVSRGACAGTALIALEAPQPESDLGIQLALEIVSEL